MEGAAGAEEKHENAMCWFGPFSGYFLAEYAMGVGIEAPGEPLGVDKGLILFPELL